MSGSAATESFVMTSLFPLLLLSGSQEIDIGGDVHVGFNSCFGALGFSADEVGFIVSCCDMLDLSVFDVSWAFANVDARRPDVERSRPCKVHVKVFA